MEPQKNRPKVGVGVVVVRHGKVLLGKRKGSHGAGSWSLSGGHLEFGESLEQCAARELSEETGLKALSFKIGPWTNDVIEKEKHYVTLFVFVDQFEGDPMLLEPDKCEGWQWFDWDDLPEPLFSPVRSLVQTVSIDKLKKISFERSQEKKLDDFLKKLSSFYQERDWEQFHSPKNLVMDLSSEVGELVEPFRWLTDEESRNLDEKTLKDVKDEIGDVFKSLLYLAQKLQIDPIEAAENTLEKMKKKYPADQSRGKTWKYTEYENK